ncbi:MAG: hypothetical protein RL341_2276 [Pseudomonadota bacterium]
MSHKRLAQNHRLCACVLLCADASRHKHRWLLLLQANQKLAFEIERALRGGNPAARPTFSGAQALQLAQVQGKSPLLAAQLLGMPLRIEHVRTLEGVARSVGSAQAWTAYAAAGRELLAIQAQLAGRSARQSLAVDQPAQPQRQPVGTSVIEKWAQEATRGVETVDQGRTVLARERAAMYRSGLNPYFANRGAFEDDLLAEEFRAKRIERLVAFLEIPAVMKPVNDLVGHVQADDVLKGVMGIAAKLTESFPEVTLYHLSAARFALEGPEQVMRAFAKAWAEELQRGELGYVTNGMQYTRTGLPVVQHEQMASSASSRRGLLFQAMDRLDQKANVLKGTNADEEKAGRIISPKRGDPLLGMTETDAAGQPNQAWFPARPARLEPDTARPTSAKDRAVELLSAPIRRALDRQVHQLNTVPELIAAIQQTVRDGFSTDAAMGAHLGNQLAYDREINYRQRENKPVFHGFVDVGGVGLTNTQISRFGGDAVLSAVHASAAAVAQRLNADMERSVPGFNKDEDQIQVFAVGGDEIRFIGTSQKAVDAFAKRFVVAMKETTIAGYTGENAEADPGALKNISLADIPIYIGTGNTEHDAEAKSNEAKATDENRLPGKLPPGYRLIER